MWPKSALYIEYMAVALLRDKVCAAWHWNDQDAPQSNAFRRLRNRHARSSNTPISQVSLSSPTNLHRDTCTTAPRTCPPLSLVRVPRWKATNNKRPTPVNSTRGFLENARRVLLVARDKSGELLGLNCQRFSIMIVRRASARWMSLILSPLSRVLSL